MCTVRGQVQIVPSVGILLMVP